MTATNSFAVETISKSTKIEQAELKMNSYSFNAHQRSNFKIYGQVEALERGLTILHLQSNNQFEYRTFDTHGSESDAQQFLIILKKIIREKSKFSILAHDSAAASLTNIVDELNLLGLPKLSSIKGRQAYVMHNFNDGYTEIVDDFSIENTVVLPNEITDTTIYFPKETYEFEPANNRFIAHAGGEVDGIKSTNSKNALDQNYKKGFRMFELDIIETSDGHWVASHDWEMWARFTDYSGSLPPTRAEFLTQRIYGDYELLDFERINEWFKNHPDATLVTDKVNDPVRFANSFVDKNRLIMELFSPMAVEKASEQGIHAMISQEPLLNLKIDKLNFLKVNNVQYVALSRRIIESQKKLMVSLRDAGIKVYVYNVNFDPGKDEKYVLENEIGLVYGMYADKWVFDTKPEKNTK
ncbi:MAG: hypothetical protein WBB24_13625 [Maribacter sp.]